MIPAPTTATPHVFASDDLQLRRTSCVPVGAHTNLPEVDDVLLAALLLVGVLHDVRVATEEHAVRLLGHRHRLKVLNPAQTFLDCQII